jgi:hypothetical protein
MFNKTITKLNVYINLHHDNEQPTHYNTEKHNDRKKREVGKHQKDYTATDFIYYLQTLINDFIEH